MRKTALATLLFVVLTGGAEDARGVPLAVDGHFADWSGSTPVCSDPAGDGAGIDFGRVWARGDSERLTMRFEVGREINLQSGNEITLLVDGDGNPGTGRKMQGLGAELVWRFGARSGTIWRGGRMVAIEQADIGIRQAPTVSSTEFEVSFSRQSADGTRVLTGPDAALVLVDGSSDHGDRLPDAGPAALPLADAPRAAPPVVSLERESPDDVRILTWNVLFDGLFKRPAPFLRVLKTIDPDVICFQEVWSHTAQEAADQVSLALPGSTWHGEHTTDGLVVSRYPFLDARAIDEAGNYWALVDLPDDRYGTDLSVVSAHPPCCDNEEGRQRELDGIAAWLRDLVTPGGLDLAPGTPLVVAGDMNLVGGARQVRTLVAGDIADEAAFGPSHAPDWDGTALSDAEPRHAGGLDTFTWRDEKGSFAPGRLDYIVYSDSVARLANAFVLAAEELPTDVLERYGLRRDDTLKTSDHLPVVADLTLAAARARAGTGE